MELHVPQQILIYSITSPITDLPVSLLSLYSLTNSNELQVHSITLGESADDDCSKI